MSWFPLPPLNANGIFLYGIMALGLAVGFSLAVPIGERVQSSLTEGGAVKGMR
tara:strand:- start:345 stop:503 length:159 start_codon:yes stop_codon:yes gene_type:complete